MSIRFLFRSPLLSRPRHKMSSRRAPEEASFLANALFPPSRSINPKSFVPRDDQIAWRVLEDPKVTHAVIAVVGNCRDDRRLTRDELDRPRDSDPFKTIYKLSTWYNSCAFGDMLLASEFVYDLLDSLPGTLDPEDHGVHSVELATVTSSAALKVKTL